MTSPLGMKIPDRRIKLLFLDSVKMRQASLPNLRRAGISPDWYGAADLRFRVQVKLAGELSREDRAALDDLLAEVSADLKTGPGPHDRNA